jgi:hypothetical protein
MAFNAQTTVTRPANATPYTAGDVVGGVIPFYDMSNANGGVLITSADLRIDVSAVPAGMTSFRLRLYSATPPSAIADNAAWAGKAVDKNLYLGYIDLGSPALAGTGGEWLECQADQNNKQIYFGGTGALYGYLVTNGGFTPAGNSEVYTPRLYAMEA